MKEQSCVKDVLFVLQRIKIYQLSQGAKVLKEDPLPDSPYNDGLWDRHISPFTNFLLP
ncbi:MAG: hypothetical protein ACYCT2_01355 [Thermoplasmataceae archaeon]